MIALWNSAIIDPMVNALVLLYGFLGNNFIIALAVFTLAVRFALLPLTLRQQRSSMKMQAMQPEIQRIQKKHRDNPQKMQEEFQKIGYNPADTLMGCLPLLIQFPIFIGLYRAIIIMLGSTPQSVYELTQQVYGWVGGLFDVSSLLPISNTFLWLNLAQPDPYFVLPVLVGATMYLSQKLMMPDTKKDEKGKGKKEENSNPMAGMTQTMTVTMPLMFGFFSMTFPAGLSVYFVVANLVGIGQGFIIRRQREGMDIPSPKRSSDDESEEEAESAADSGSGKNDKSNRANGSGSSKKQYKKRKKRRSKR